MILNAHILHTPPGQSCINNGAGICDLMDVRKSLNFSNFTAAKENRRYVDPGRATPLILGSLRPGEYMPQVGLSHFQLKL